MQSLESETMWTPKECAEFFGVCEKTLFTMYKKRGLPHFRNGRVLRFLPSQVKQWASEQRHGDQSSEAAAA